MKKLFKKINAKAAAVSVAALVTVQTASADLPAGATSAVTAVSDGITDTVDAAWPLIGAALAAGVIIKLVKRFVKFV